MAKLHPPAGKGAYMETTTRCVANRLWQKQLLTDATVRKWLIRTMGEHAIHVIQEFTQDLSDEQIAQKAGIRASDVRVVLNKLHSYSLATYARNRDKNSGWYSYVWHLNNEHLSEMVDKVKREAGEIAPAASAQIEEGEKYFCQQCGPASCVDFERASALLFRCEQCGGSLAFVEQKKQGETTMGALSG
jgi:transcription factor E